MNLSMPKVLMLLLILTTVGIASGFSEDGKVNFSKKTDVKESGIQVDVEPIIKALGSENLDSRREARITLEKMGEEVVDPLIEANASENLNIRCETAIALGNIGGQKAEKS